MRRRGILQLAFLFAQGCAIDAAGRGPTTLSDATLAYRVPERAYVILERGPSRVVIANNEAVDDAELPGHRAGYSGVARWQRYGQPERYFVPKYCGLNFEHIHDGTTQDWGVLFEPRNAPMELRQIDEHTVELYQAPTPTWALESVQQFRLLADGALELVIDWIPHRRVFRHEYIGLFWASYILQPESGELHFRGMDASDGSIQWLRTASPKHGLDAAHRFLADERRFAHDPEFPLTLVFSDSGKRYNEPWFFGVREGLALVQLFRPQDQVRFAQSPSGGGRGNPAWDFQFLQEDFEVGRRYRLCMRAALVPFESPQQVAREVRDHRRALGQELSP